MVEEQPVWSQIPEWQAGQGLLGAAGGRSGEFDQTLPKEGLIKEVRGVAARWCGSLLESQGFGKLESLEKFGEVEQLRTLKKEAKRREKI